jgi:hypothetical protein
MENRWQYEAMGSGESREELEGLIDNIDEEEWEIARRYHPLEFDRRAINQKLAALTSNAQGGSPMKITIILQVRVRVRNDELGAAFQRWYPKLGSGQEAPLAA